MPQPLGLTEKYLRLFRVCAIEGVWLAGLFEAAYVCSDLKDLSREIESYKQASWRICRGISEEGRTRATPLGHDRAGAICKTESEGSPGPGAGCCASLQCTLGLGGD